MSHLEHYMRQMQHLQSAIDDTLSDANEIKKEITAKEKELTDYLTHAKETLSNLKTFCELSGKLNIYEDYKKKVLSATTSKIQTIYTW